MGTRIAVLLSILLLCAWQAISQDGLLFYASFDNGIKPEKAQGGEEPPYLAKVKNAPGRVGNCVVVPRDSQLIYEGLGNAYVAAGTVSFFWRADEDLAGKSFTILDMSPLERINYSRWMRLSYSGETLDLFSTLGHKGARGFRAERMKGKFRTGEWHHIALAWDQTRGVAIYADGKLAGQVKEEWIYDGNVNHIGLGITTRPDFRPGGAEHGQSYDELRIYDRWLDDSEIAALANGDVPKIAPPSFAPFLELRRKVYSWTGDEAGMPEVIVGPDGKGLGLKQVGVLTARDVARTTWRTFDGERGRRWPGGAGYTNAGRELNITLYPGESFDVVQMYAMGTLKLVVPDDATTLLEIKDMPLAHARTVLAKPVSRTKLAVQRENGGIHEMGLFKRVPYTSEGGGGWQLFALRPATPADEQIPEIVTSRRTFFTPDHTVILAAEKGEGRITFPALRAVHLLGPEHKERQGLAAISLDLEMAAGGAGNLLRVDVTDPLTPVSPAVTADLRLTGQKSGRMRLMLDVRDMVLLPGARPCMSLTFRDDAVVLLESSRVGYRWISVAEALKEHSPDQLARGKDIFQEISESRPWGHSPKRLKTLGMLLNIIDELRTLQPQDPVIGSYWHWVHPGEQKAIIEPPLVPEGIPAWAVYLDAAIEALKRVPYWWIDNRENEFGEFGANDGINDDTDLVQDWWAMHLMRGPDRKLFDSLKRVADNSWRVTMRETGLGHYTDTLHTYEDGMNAQCHMALMDYGNPVYFERLFASIRHYKDLMAVNKAGHLHFRASWYGYSSDGRAAVDKGRYAYDSGSNALTLQPAMLVAWYNGNEYCRKVLTDWTDAMIAHCMEFHAKEKRVSGCSVRFESDETVRSRSFGYGFFDAPWACYEFTGEQKYLDFIKLGRLAEIAQYRHPRQTGTVADRYIAETGDIGLKDRFVERASDPTFWKGSLHNDNYYELDTFYLAWQCTGDIKFINEGTKLTLNDITWELPMLTVGEQSTDRVWTPQRLVNRIALGGPAMLRNELFPKLAASWENATGRVAPFVKSQSRKQMEVWICNLEERPVDVTMRLWRLEHGQYVLREGLDQNQDGQFDAPPSERRMTLARFDTVPVKLPPRSLWLVICKQEKPLDDIRARADLAICAEDMTFDREAGTLTFVIHNIGAKPSGPFHLRVSSAGKTVLERKDMPSLDFPADLQPKVMQMRVENLRGKESTPLLIELDPESKISEITRVNNRLEVIPSKLPPPRPATTSREK